MLELVAKTLGWKISERIRGENPDFWTLELPPFAQFKNQAKFEVEIKRKVVDLVKMYNFGVLSFWSFNTKFKVILKIQISRKCPLFQFEPPIQNLFGILKSDQHESCRAQKVEQLSCWEFFKLFGKIKSNFGNSDLAQFKNLNFPDLRFELQTVLANSLSSTQN